MMKNNRYRMPILTFFLIGFLIGALCLTGCTSAPEEKKQVDSSLLDTSPVTGKPNNPYAGMTPEEFMAAMGLTPGMESTGVSALYKWYGRSFSELEAEATQIVIARGVNSYKKSDITKTAELQVLKTIKGNKHDTIVLYQFEGEVDIQTGEAYILFMKSQENNVANGYYALAGNQGVMHINSASKQVTTYDQHVTDDDLAVWIENNIAGDSDLGAFYSKTQAYSVQFVRN